MRPSISAASNGGCVHAAGSPSVATSSSGSTRARTRFNDTSAPRAVALLGRERENDRVEADHAELVARHVEVVALDFFRALLERDHGLHVRHLAEGVRAFVEAVT